MNLIVAVDKNWAIGYQNQLLMRIPADQKFFREETTSKVVVMGRKTLETFPGGLPLKQRVNVVITSDKNYKLMDAVIAHSIEEALDAVKDYKTEDIYIIGGSTIYNQMLSLCEVAIVTKIDYAYVADTYFPNIDEMEDWVLTSESDAQSYQDSTFTFCKYERKK